MRRSRALSSALVVGTRRVLATAVLSSLAVCSLPPIAWSLSGLAQEVPAAPREIARFFPSEVWAYSEVAGAGELARGFPESRLFRQVTEHPLYAAYEDSEAYKQLLAGLGFVRLMAGQPPVEVAEAALGRRIAGAVLPSASADQGLAWLLALETEDEAASQMLGRLLIGVATSQGADRLVRGEHRGLEGFAIDGELSVGRWGRYLIASNREEVLEAAVDRVMDAGESFFTSATYEPVSRRLAGGAVGAVFADLAVLREMTGAGRFGEERGEETLASLLFQNLIDVANQADSLVGRIDADGEEFALEVELPVNPQELPERLAFCEHERALSQGLRELTTSQTFATIRGWRDVSAFWEDREKLLTEVTEKGFAEFESGLGTFFSGKSVPDELLPMLYPEWLLVGARQTFSSGPTPPKVKFPAGAVVLHAREAEKLMEEMSVALHSLLSVLNIERGQNGQTPFRLYVEPYEGAMVYGGRYLEDDGRPYDMARYNFSPAITRVGDRIVVSTTGELLRDLVDALQSPPALTSEPGVLTQLRIDVAPALKALEENREALVAQTVTDEGKSFEEAEQQWDLILMAGAQFDSMELTESVGQSGVSVRLGLRWRGPSPFSSAEGDEAVRASDEE